MKIADKIQFDYARLRPQEQIPEHTQDTWELAYVTVGRGMRTIGDTTEPFFQGEVVLVPPGLNHHWRFDPDFTDSDGNIADIAIFIPPSQLNDIAAALPDFADAIAAINRRSRAVKFEGRRKEMIQSLMRQMVEASAPALKTALFLSVISLIGVEADDESTVGRRSEISHSKQKIEQVRIYCECNVTRPVRLRDAAGHVGMNVTSFCKFFLKNFGCTFTEFINRLRVNESCRRLTSTSDPISEIAYSVGFASVPYFNRVFSRHRGCTPSRFRVMSRQPENGLK